METTRATSHQVGLTSSPVPVTPNSPASARWTSTFAITIRLIAVNVSR